MEETFGLDRVMAMKLAASDLSGIEQYFIGPLGDAKAAPPIYLLKDKKMKREAEDALATFGERYSQILGNTGPTITNLAEDARVNEQTVRKLIQEILVMLTGKDPQSLMHYPQRKSPYKYVFCVKHGHTHRRGSDVFKRDSKFLVEADGHEGGPPM